MAYEPSTPPDITEAIPFPLTAGGQQAQSSFPADERFDINLGGLGFLLRPTGSNPYLRASEQASKQRVDTAPEAGEQSLGSWWIRSQTSWHMGAGIDWYEPGSDEATAYRFHNSHNVDVWTPGEVKLLPQTLAVSPQTEPAYLSTVVTPGGEFGVCYAAGNQVQMPGHTAASLTSGSATQPAVAGDVIYVGHEDAVSVGDLTAGGVTKVRDTTGVARCWWVKSRLFVTVGPAIYWVDPSTTSGTLPVGSTDELIWTHPDPDWVWTDVAPTGDSVLLSGHGASRGSVFSLTVAEEGGIPDFTTPTETASLPPGELVTCMGTYLNAYIVLGTTKGVRVGEIGANGQIQYGQLTVETDEPVVDVTFADRFAYLPVSRNLADGSSGAVRVDLSVRVPNTTAHPWAWDLSTGGTPTMASLAFVGAADDPQVLMASDESLYMPSDSLSESGWIQSGKIRYGTTEPKNFRFVRLNGSLHGGLVRMVAIADDNEHNIITYTPQSGMEGQAAVNIPNQRPLTYLSVRLHLEPGSGDEDNPTVEGLAVKALPATRKARLFRFPLSCYDTEVDRHGNEVGYEGAAHDRLVELEEIETDGRPLMVKDRRTGEAFVGVIESIEFAGAAAPERGQPNFGGNLEVTVRRL